jgi:glucokinase
VASDLTSGTGGPALVVLVTGVPASGKSSLARPLCEALGLPLLSKDVVKEALFDALGIADREWALRLGAASAEVLWSLLPHCPRGAVVDIWIDPRRDVEVARAGLARSGTARVMEVLCDCPGEVAVARYAERVRHPGHQPPDENILRRIRESALLIEPLGLGPALRLDTSGPVDVEAVLSWLRAGVASPG